MSKSTKSKSKPYTVVGLCLCGCDESFVHFVNAKDEVEAPKKIRKEEARIISVFEGHIHDLHCP